jgi:hypothetical protein
MNKRGFALVMAPMTVIIIVLIFAALFFYGGRLSLNVFEPRGSWSDNPTCESVDDCPNGYDACKYPHRDSRKQYCFQGGS